MNIPQVTEHIPHVVPFVDRLHYFYENGELGNWVQMRSKVKIYYNLMRKNAVEACVPGWIQQASQRGGATLVHIHAALLALRYLPEFVIAPPEHQAMMTWIVLFHDVAKDLSRYKRDFTHGFRSAAVTGVQLPKFGFEVTLPHDDALTEWATYTHRAIHWRLFRSGIQNNRKLPHILEGIDAFYGAGSPGAIIVKTVLLHMSLDVVEEYPQTAPLNERQIRRFISPEVLPFLKMMMLVDNDAWSFYEPDTRARHRAETLAVFERVHTLINE